MEIEGARLRRLRLAAAWTQQELADAFGGRLLPAIPRRVAIGEAHAAGQDIFAYDAGSDGAQAYEELIREIVNRG